MKVIGDDILVLEIKSNETKTGGIYIPESLDEKIKIGKVVKVGLGTKDNPMDKVKENDIIYFDGFSGIKLKIDGVEYLEIKESNVRLIK